MPSVAYALLRVFFKRRITLNTCILCAAFCDRRAVAPHFRRQTVVSGRISSAPMTRALARVRSSLLAMLVGLFVLVSALLGCLPKAQAQDLSPDLGPRLDLHQVQLVLKLPLRQLQIALRQLPVNCLVQETLVQLRLHSELHLKRLGLG